MSWGWFPSLNNPGGTYGVSVFTTDLAGKRLQLLHELAPRASPVGLLVSPTYPGSAAEVAAVREAAAVVGRLDAVVEASTEGEIDAAFTTLARQQADASLLSGRTHFLLVVEIKKSRWRLNIQ